MTHENHASHVEHVQQDHSGARPYFPESEWEWFQKEDIQAGQAIVLLMLGIFSIGLVMYFIVALICA